MCFANNKRDGCTIVPLKALLKRLEQCVGVSGRRVLGGKEHYFMTMCFLLYQLPEFYLVLVNMLFGMKWYGKFVYELATDTQLFIRYFKRLKTE